MLARTKSCGCICDGLFDGRCHDIMAEVVIPLDAFMNISNWTSIKDVSIVFENTQSGWKWFTIKRTVYIHIWLLVSSS